VWWNKDYILLHYCVHFESPGLLQFSADRCQRRSPSTTIGPVQNAAATRLYSHRHPAMWTHHSSTAAAALATCAATYPVQAGESRPPCTVGLGAGLPSRRLSVGCRFWTEIPAVRQATCLLRATPKGTFGDWSFAAAGPRAWNVRDTELSLTTFNAHLKTYLFSTVFETTAHLWHLWFLCAAYKCTYLLTYLV